MPLDFKPIVDAVQRHFARELADALPELNEAVQVAQKGASFTATLQIAKAKRGRIVAKLGCRVRAPREPIEIDMHIQDGQLVLGFDEAVHGIVDGSEDAPGMAGDEDGRAEE